MQVNTVEKLASVGAFGLWAALHGWLGWLAVLYAICMLLDLSLIHISEPTRPY